MTFTFSTRAIAGAAAGLLAAGSAAVLGASTAEAAPVSLTTTYTCTNAFLGAGDYTAKLSLDVPTTAIAGSTIPSRQVAVEFTIPDSVVDTARSFGITSFSGKATGVKARVGAMEVPVSDIVFPSTPLPADGPMTVTSTATVSSFTAPGAGSYEIKVPTAFLVTVTTAPTPLTVDINCALKAGSPESLGSVVVTKATTTTTAKLKKKPATTAKRAKVVVTVASSGGGTPSGTVTATLKKKTIASKVLANGKAILKLPKLKAGKAKLLISYPGDASNEASSTKLTIKVKQS